MAIGQACVDRVARYVGERRQFGRPIVEFQMVQQLADMIVHVEAAIAPEYHVERHHRDAIGWALAGGTPAMQRIRIVSQYLKRPFSQRTPSSR